MSRFLLLIALIFFIGATHVQAVYNWAYHTPIIVNTFNSSGSYVINGRSSLQLEFQVVNNTNFELTASQVLVLLDNSISGIRFDVNNRDRFIKAVKTVKISYLFPDGLFNLITNTVDIRFSDDHGWKNMPGKEEKTFTSVSYEVDVANFPNFNSSFSIGLFGKFTNSDVELGIPIEVYGPTSVYLTGIKNVYQRPSLYVSLPNQPISENPGSISFYQKDVPNDIFPVTLNPIFSFSFVKSASVSSNFNIRVSFSNDFPNLREIPKLYCSCFSTNSSSFKLLQEIDNSNQDYYFSGDVTGCTTISFSTPIPESISPGQQLDNLKYSSNFPISFIKFTNTTLSGFYTLSFVGYMQVTVYSITWASPQYQVQCKAENILILEGPSSYFMTIDRTNSFVMDVSVSLSKEEKLISASEYESQKMESKSLLIGISSGFGISAVLNLILVIVVCVLGSMIWNGKKYYIRLKH